MVITANLYKFKYLGICHNIVEEILNDCGKDQALLAYDLSFTVVVVVVCLFNVSFTIIIFTIIIIISDTFNVGIGEHIRNSSPTKKNIKPMSCVVSDHVLLCNQSPFLGR